MTEDTESIIEARAAPLSHLEQKQSAGRLSDLVDRRGALMIGIVAVAIIAAMVWEPETSDSTDAPQAPAAGSFKQKADSVSERASESVQRPAPFAASQRERVRTQAQDALSQFVEQQILLEDTMQVTTWGADELEAAMSQAQQGDIAFLREDFDAALQAYESALKLVKQVVELGNQHFAAHLSHGQEMITALQAEAAAEAIGLALAIKPSDPEAQFMLAQAQQLPLIISKLREAKNHELSRRYKSALSLYDEIQKLAPNTPGLDALRAQAQSNLTDDNVTQYISDGFVALDENRFEDAKRSFRSALQLKPANNIAQGGLQQVAERSDLAKIKALQNRATQALAAEQWQPALDAFQSVLDLDANIQFALNGLAASKAHLRAQQLLEKITQSPQKLSSQKLYLEAQTIAEEASTLTYAGPELQSLTQQVQALLVTYRDPVEVVLTSDNATRIILSNVGDLGFFRRKTLSLRPGMYTVRGSQNGCRDIYRSLEVLPGMAPVTLSCPEQLQAVN